MTPERVKEILDEEHGDRVYLVTKDRVWVSGMNQQCGLVAQSMVRTLEAEGIDCSRVNADRAARFGGVEFTHRVQ